MNNYIGLTVLHPLIPFKLGKVEGVAAEYYLVRDDQGGLYAVLERHLCVIEGSL